MTCETLGTWNIMAQAGPDILEEVTSVTIRLDSFTKNMPKGLNQMHGSIRDIRRNINAWNFNVFELPPSARKRPLFAVTMALLEEHKLLDGWLLDREVTAKYVAQIENVYKADNPYHNNTHAADVTQTAGVIMLGLNRFMAAAGRPLTKMERFCILFASAVHDLGHPGVNNDFLVRTRERQALVYNDRSVNENMHASLAFQIAHDNPDMNIFANFSEDEFKEARNLIVAMVLSTDMAVHFDLLAAYNKHIKAKPNPKIWDLATLSLVLQMLVHLADLANPSRPFTLALRWAERVITEFMNQGLQELRAGLTISPMCDRSKICMPAAQLMFIEKFMQPTLEAFAAVAPSFANMTRPWLADTQAKWQYLLQQGVKYPAEEGESYPELPQELQEAMQQLAVQLDEQQQQQDADEGLQ